MNTELDITEFFNTVTPEQFSNSIANSGLDNIGSITWNNAREEAQENPLFSECNRKAVIKFFDGFGAWDDLEEWPIEDLNALLIQMISGDIQEGLEESEPWNWIDYENQSEMGIVSGRLFQGSDGRVYYYIGE